MEVEIKTRIPLVPGKEYYVCEKTDEYLYGPCGLCDGTGTVKIAKKERIITCPECHGEDSMKCRNVGYRTKWRIAKYCLSSIEFNEEGSVECVYLRRSDKHGSTGKYLRTGNTENSLKEMTVYNEKLSDNYSEVLAETKRRNKSIKESEKNE